MALFGLSFLELFLTASAIFLGFIWFSGKKKKDPRYPPGPPGLPVVGNLFQLGTQPFKAMNRLADQYGECFSLKLPNEESIVLNDPKLIKDVFNESSSAGRTSNPVFLAFSKGKHGIVFNDGVHWEQQRRFTLRTLRDFGFAKSAMEGMILEEANSMLKYFEKHVNKPIIGNRIFNGAVVNSLWNIISGERSEWDAPEQPRIITAAKDFIQRINDLTKSGVLMCPFLRFIIPDTVGWTAYMEAVKNVIGICNKAKETHIAKLNPDSPHDFIDHYLIEMNNEKDPTSSFYKETGERNLSSVLPELFIAGSDTTSHNLSWTLLFLAHHPQIQKKLQEEIDAVVGPGRQPSIADKTNMPYTEAVIMEVLRRSSVVNVGVPHRMMEDVVINGYFFPKDTSVISNIWYVNNNPKVWGDPQNFRPERFLSPDGKSIVRHEAFIPFSLGKRQCLGKSLAEDTLFLFVTCIFQKLTITPDPASTKKELTEVEPGAGLINEPMDFKIVANLRSN